MNNGLDSAQRCRLRSWNGGAGAIGGIDRTCAHRESTLHLSARPGDLAKALHTAANASPWLAVPPPAYALTSSTFPVQLSSIAELTESPRCCRQRDFKSFRSVSFRSVRGFSLSRSFGVIGYKTSELRDLKGNPTHDNPCQRGINQPNEISRTTDIVLQKCHTETILEPGTGPGLQICEHSCWAETASRLKKSSDSS